MNTSSKSISINLQAQVLLLGVMSVLLFQLKSQLFQELMSRLISFHFLLTKLFFYIPLLFSFPSLSRSKKLPDLIIFFPYSSNGPLTHSCSSGGLALGINNRVQYATKFPVISNQKFHTSFEEFTVKETSYINFEVEFDFLSSDVQLLLAGNLDSGRNISYVGTIHENSRVIDEVSSSFPLFFLLQKSLTPSSLS